jgi:hypothetical protein
MSELEMVIKSVLAAVKNEDWVFFGNGVAERASDIETVATRWLARYVRQTVDYRNESENKHGK